MAKITENCIKLVKEFEGCYLKAYKDEVGVWTIGYGITNSDKSITGTTIKQGLVITKAQADTWLRKSLEKKYLPLVTRYNSKYDWNQNQIDALVSFCYNIGSIGGLTASGTRSNAEIAKKMLGYNKAGGKVYKGLTRRRKAEHDLFVKAVASKKKSNQTSTSKKKTEGSKYMFSVSTVKKGSTGKDVELMQRLLKSRGYKGKDGKTLEIDKSCGENTLYALEAFQKKNKLTADKICGKSTWKKLLLR